MKNAGRVMRKGSRGRWHYPVGTLLVSVITLASAVGLTLGAAHTQSGATTGRLVTVEVVVAPGDTLWSIAQRHVSREVDLRAAVDSILAKNGLSSTALRPGQVLLVEVEIPRVEATDIERVATAR